MLTWWRRNLQNTVEWLYCDSQLIYYMKVHVPVPHHPLVHGAREQNLKDSMFPETPIPVVARTRSMKEATKIEVSAFTQLITSFSTHDSQASDRLQRNLPSILITLVGQTQARAGVERVFQSFQNLHTNKHVFYIMLEAILYKLFDELPQRELVAAFVCQPLEIVSHLILITTGVHECSVPG